MERLDRVGTQIVPFAYLAALMGGTAFYFTDGQWGVFTSAILIIGGSVAVATELHSFLTQRRARIAWKKWRKTPRELEGNDNPAYAAARGDFFAQIGILLLLVCWQCFTAIMYRYATWHPRAGLLSSDVQIVLSGAIIPFFFLMAGFLVDIAADPAETMQQTAAHILGKTQRAMFKQWNRRIDKATRKNANLAPLTIRLTRFVGDEATANLIAEIDAGLSLVESPTAAARIAAPAALEEESEKFGEEEESGPIPFDMPRDNVSPNYRAALAFLRADPEASIYELQAALGLRSYSTAHKYWYQVRSDLGIETVPRRAPRERVAR